MFFIYFLSFGVVVSLLTVKYFENANITPAGAARPDDGLHAHHIKTKFQRKRVINSIFRMGGRPSRRMGGLPSRRMYG
jgi:hypothetical protein